MAKKCYIGIDGAARKVSKGYVGVDGMARKIKRAYIGIGGVARPCWSGGALAYYGEIDPLSTARYYNYSYPYGSVGNYGLFIGGENAVGTMEGYSKSLVKTSVMTLTKPRLGSVSCNAGSNLILYSGGEDDGGDGYNWSSNAVINASLTETLFTDGKNLVMEAGAAPTGDYAVFVGGQYTGVERKYVAAISSAITATTPTTLVSTGGAATGEKLGNRAAFNVKGTVETYDASLTYAKASAGTSRRRMQHARLKNHAIFAGGQSTSSTSTYYKQIYAYDTSLTQTQLGTLDSAYKWCVGASIDGYAMFAGGFTGNSNSSGATSNVEVFDESLTKTIFTPLSTARACMGAVTAGDYVLFGGGSISAGRPGYTAVEAYTI